MDFPDYPIIKLPNSEKWESAYEYGSLLEKQFPNQSADDFATMNSYNDVPVDYKEGVRQLILVHDGEKDEDSWIWSVQFGNKKWFTVMGWCDYTGWDCQSGSNWFEIGTTR